MDGIFTIILTVRGESMEIKGDVYSVR